MASIYVEVALQLGAAWAAGGLIGFERTYHGRAAGFRTHALVCLGGAAAMMIALAPTFAAGVWPGDAPRLDPTRLAQVLNNLLDNAVGQSGQGPELGSLTLILVALVMIPMLYYLRATKRAAERRT